MQKRFRLPMLTALLAAASVALAAATNVPPPPAAAPALGATPLISGWTLLKEGEAEGMIEVDAKNPNNPNPHLLKISVTKYSDSGKGRVGAKNSTPIAVKEGMSYDISFNGTSEGIGVGLVFSLETDDGAVLARTTLPEIGRAGGGRGGARGRGGAAAAPATADSPAVAPTASPWRRYLLSLNARATAANAHLTVTSIEPVPVWIENLTIVERQAAK